MVPARRLRCDLYAGRGRADGFQHCQGISLGVVGIDWTRRFGPMAAVIATPAQAGGNKILTFRRGVAELRPNLEQSHVVKATVAVAARRQDQIAQHGGAHGVQFR